MKPHIQKEFIRQWAVFLGLLLVADECLSPVKKTFEPLVGILLLDSATLLPLGKHTRLGDPKTLKFVPRATGESLIMRKFGWGEGAVIFFETYCRSSP